MTNKSEVIKNCRLKCSRCDQSFASGDLRAEVLIIGLLTVTCPKCGTTLTVSTFPAEYLTIIEEPAEAPKVT